MKTGNGKIANLPAEIRDELNYRLADGEQGIELVEWLNAKPEVVKVIRERFDGTPISEQNLSEWRKRGYQKWLAFHNFVDESNALGDNAEVIAETGIDCDKLLLTLTAAYADMIRNWIITPGEQMTYKMAVYKNLTNGVIALQRAELQKVRLEIARERLELLREKRRDKSDEAIGRGAGVGAGGCPGKGGGPGKSRASHEVYPSAAPVSSSAESVSAASDERPKVSEHLRSEIPVTPPSNEKLDPSQNGAADAGAGSQDPASGMIARQPAPVAASSLAAPCAPSSGNSPAASGSAPAAPSKAAAPPALPFRPNPRAGGPPRNATPRNPLGLL